jgi:hypothetical protein
MVGHAGAAALTIGPAATGQAARLKHSRNARFSASDPPNSREDILKPHELEERIYRLRCVEAWSTVVPWVGFPLADLVKRFRPTSHARYVAFKTVLRLEEMPGQRVPVLRWPYVEGLRMVEAMHPLTLLAAGLYGEFLPNQNGAHRLAYPAAILGVTHFWRQVKGDWREPAVYAGTAVASR